jgi:hypothetical protein
MHSKLWIIQIIVAVIVPLARRIRGGVGSLKQAMLNDLVVVIAAWVVVASLAWIARP